jgi:hypothetical protein
MINAIMAVAIMSVSSIDDAEKSRTMSSGAGTTATDTMSDSNGPQ